MKLLNAYVTKSKKGSCIKVRIVTKYSKRSIIDLKEEYVKVGVKSSPVNNKANLELISYFSKIFKASKSKIHFISGMKSKNKLLEIEDLEADMVKEFLRKENAKT